MFFFQQLQIQDMLLQSLMEMEFMHRAQELEHLELERALTLSMTVEEERLRLLMADAKMAEFELESALESATASTAAMMRRAGQPRSESKVS